MSCACDASPTFRMEVYTSCGIDQPSTVSTRLYHGDGIRLRLQVGTFGPEGAAPAALYWQIFDPTNEEGVPEEPVEVSPDEEGRFDFVVLGFENDTAAQARRTVLQMVVVYPDGQQRTILYDVWVLRRYQMNIPGAPEASGALLHMTFLSALVEGVTQ